MVHLVGDRAERGQAVPLITLVIALAAAAVMVIASVGARADRLARAQAAADAVALAGAAGTGAIDEIAAANDAVIIESSADLVRYSVTVEVDGASATASAVQPTPNPRLVGLQPALIAAIRTAEVLLGEPIAVVSGRRTRAEQQWLWDTRHDRPYPVAPPGTSAHETGLAIDVSPAQVGRLALVAARAGLCRPLPHTDPVHFQLCPRT